MPTLTNRNLIVNITNIINQREFTKTLVTDNHDQIIALSHAFAVLYEDIITHDNSTDTVKLALKEAGRLLLPSVKGTMNTSSLIKALALAGFEADFISAFFNGMVDSTTGKRFVSRPRVSQCMAELGIDSTTHGASVKASGMAGKPAKSVAEREFERIQTLNSKELKSLIAMMRKAGMI